MTFPLNHPSSSFLKARALTPPGPLTTAENTPGFFDFSGSVGEGGGGNTAAPIPPQNKPLVWQRAPSQDTRYRYVDLNTLYTINSYPLQITDQNAVLNEFGNLVRTNPGEVWFEPLYGAGLRLFLFDNITPNMAFMAINKTAAACDRWLPQVRLYRDLCSAEQIREDAWHLSFTLSINQASPVTLGITLYENS